MTLSTYKPGPFDYTPIKPSVPAIDYQGRPMTPRALADVQRTTARVLRGIAPTARVEWGVQGFTDHSIYDDKAERWIVKLDTRRIASRDRDDAETGQYTTQNTLTDNGVLSVIGAAIHELGHVLGSPTKWDLTKRELAVFRVYEDMYVNAHVIKTRTPGGFPFLQAAYNWTWPRSHAVDAVNNALNQPSFDSYVMALAGIHLIAAWINEYRVLHVPDELRDLAAEVDDIAAPLLTGAELPFSERVDIYRDIVNAILNALPDGADTGDGSDPQAGQGDGHCNGNHADPANDGTKPGGVCDGTCQQGDGDAQGNGAGSQPATQSQGQKGQRSDKGERKERDLNCEGDGGADLGPAVNRYNPANQAASEANAINEARDSGEVVPDGELNYTVAQPNEFDADSLIDKQRVMKLAKVFKAKSNIRRQLHHGETHGRLSQRRLHRAVEKTPPPTLFKTRPNQANMSAAVGILVDGSGSMAGIHYNTAAQAAAELFQALRLNADFKVYAWAFSTDRGRDVAVRAASFKGGKTIWPALMNGGTPSHAAMKQMADFLRVSHPYHTRVIIHFSDLEFGDHPGADFITVEEDKGLKYMTVTVKTGYVDHYRQQFPQMHISGYPASELVDAVQEFVAESLN